MRRMIRHPRARLSSLHFRRSGSRRWRSQGGQAKRAVNRCEVAFDVLDDLLRETRVIAARREPLPPCHRWHQ